MRRVRRVGVIAVTALALASMTATTASATTITSNGNPYSGPLTATANIANFNGIWNYYCQSSLSGNINSNGTGTINSLTFSTCQPWANCKAIVSGLPYSFNLNYTGPGRGQGTINSNVTINSGCTAAQCLAQAGPGVLTVRLNGTVLWIEGTLPNGLCANTRITAPYGVTTPANIGIQP